MPTYYVSSAGLDANNGLGPDASAATNKPWLTLGKALNTGSVVVPGDTIYIGPGVLFEGAAVSPIAGVSSSGSPTAVRGDPLNAQGFKDAAGVALVPGVCHISTRSATDGLDGPILLTTQAELLTPATGCHGMQWYDLSLESNPAPSQQILGCVDLLQDSHADWLFDGCRLTGLHAIAYRNNNAPTAGRNLTVRRCVLNSAGALYCVSSSSAATPDADLNIVFEHNLLFGVFGTTTALAITQTGGNLAGGITFRGNTIVRAASQNNTACITGTALSVSTVVPIRLSGNICHTGTVTGGTLGQIVDDGYNRFSGNAAHSNFLPAPTSKIGYAPLFIWPDLLRWGLELPRMDFFGWSDQAPSTLRFTDWTNTGADFRGTTARPWGPGASIGCWEAGLYLRDTASQVTGGGATSLAIYGAGELLVPIPVDAVATTITLVTKSVAYVGTNWPQMIVQANPSLGITAQTATATSAAEQTLTIGPVTPTGSGVLLVRLVSRNGQRGGQTFFDVFQAA